MPTPAELKTEIETGPLAADLAPFWADVFAEPGRAGRLKPDAAFAIHQILTDPTRATKPGAVVMSRGAFLSVLAGFAPALATKDAVTQSKWGLLLNLATGGDTDVRVSRPEIQGLFDLAVAERLIGQAVRDAMRAPTSVPCSRSEALGWNGWGYRLAITAKGIK